MLVHAQARVTQIRRTPSRHESGLSAVRGPPEPVTTPDVSEPSRHVVNQFSLRARDGLSASPSVTTAPRAQGSSGGRQVNASVVVVWDTSRGSVLGKKSGRALSLNNSTRPSICMDGSIARQGKP